ncbi:hypothetical protein [Bradyrhizobium sp. Y36]|uniref:hypothetical protein n=1 Tax=Bradyrhizobium sp. Y36 TaxID=2035447 RepID=UPI0011778BFF|nr:hypothetical protein [Bradyrhizobium sp. Y36]
MVVSKLIDLSLPAAHGGFSLRRGIRQYLPAKRKSPACERACLQAAPCRCFTGALSGIGPMATRLTTAAGEIAERVADDGCQCRTSNLERRGLLDSDRRFDIPLMLICGLNRLAALHRNIH